MKLFIVINVDEFFLSHRKEIAIAAKKAGHNVTIITSDTGRKADIESLGFRFINLPIDRSGMNIFSELKTFWFLLRLYIRERPDVVHHVGLKTILWGSLAAKLSSIKGEVNAISGLGVLFTGKETGIIPSLLLRVLKFSHNKSNVIVIFQNHEDQNLFLSKGILNSTQCVFIKGSGVDLSLFNYTQEPEEARIRVIFTARMVAEKGVLILVQAANILRQEYSEKVEFILCGKIDDNPSALSEREILAMCDGNYVRWLGFRSDILMLLKSSHIMAFPSYYKEGLPKSLIEASAIGLPIITTDSTGCRDTVEDGINGYLVPIKNPIALADKLKRLIDDKSLRLKMRCNSRRIAERDYDIKTVIKKHIDIYNTLNS